MDNSKAILDFYTSEHVGDMNLYPLIFSFVNSCLFPISFNLIEDKDELRARLEFLGYEQRIATMCGDLVTFEKIKRQIDVLLDSKWSSVGQRLIFLDFEKYDFTDIAVQVVFNKLFMSYTKHKLGSLLKEAAHQKRYNTLPITSAELYTYKNNSYREVNYKRLNEIERNLNIELLHTDIFDKQILDSILGELIHINSTVIKKLKVFPEAIKSNLVNVNNISISELFSSENISVIYKMIISTFQHISRMNISDELFDFYKKDIKETIKHEFIDIPKNTSEIIISDMISGKFNKKIEIYKTGDLLDLISVNSNHITISDNYLLYNNKYIDFFRFDSLYLNKYLDVFNHQLLYHSDKFIINSVLYDGALDKTNLIKMNDQLIKFIKIEKYISKELSWAELINQRKHVIVDSLIDLLHDMNSYQQFDFNLRLEDTKRHILLSKISDATKSEKFIEIVSTFIYLDKLIKMMEFESAIIGIIKDTTKEIVESDIQKGEKINKNIVFTVYDTVKKLSSYGINISDIKFVSETVKKDIYFMDPKETFKKYEKTKNIEVDAQFVLLDGKFEKNVSPVKQKVGMVLKLGKDTYIDLNIPLNLKKDDITKIVALYNDIQLIGKNLKNVFLSNIHFIQKNRTSIDLFQPNFVEKSKTIIDLSSLVFGIEHLKYFSIFDYSIFNKTTKNFDLNRLIQLQYLYKDVIILSEELYTQKQKLLTISMQEFIYTELYKRWYFVPSDGPHDWMILPGDYPYGALPMDGINKHPIPKGFDRALNEIPVDIHIISNVLDFCYNLWEAHWQLYTRYTPSQSVKHFVNLIYDWLEKYVPEKIYRMPEYNPDDYAVLNNYEVSREDYWRLYRWIRWYAEAIVLNVPEEDKNSLNGNIYIRYLIQDLVKYFDDHHGRYINPYTLGNTKFDKIKGKRHRWIELFNKIIKGGN